MPSKHRLKIYVEDSYYHVFNRGVNKAKIFIDEQDYWYFIKLISRYLEPYNNEEAKGEYPNFAGEVSIVAYCLMPNHFHILLHQVSEQGMTKFMRALSTSYTMYMNKKYHRVGTLFQGSFKAIHISNDSYLTHLSRYIHRNPNLWELYPHSSYRQYLKTDYPYWLQNDIVLSQFKDIAEYKQFTKDYDKYPELEIEEIY